MVTALTALVTWPIRWTFRRWRGRKARRRRKVRRVVVLGLDGLDPLLVDEYPEQGLLPNLFGTGRARLGHLPFLLAELRAV